MKILINASNLKMGGALQVTDSICKQLYKYQQHKFDVVLSSALIGLKSVLENVDNINVSVYDIRNNVSTIFRGRDYYLDNLVNEKGIDVVLTIFGPSRWNPRCKHLCGFAMPHLVIPESPFFSRMNFVQRFKHRFRSRTLTYFFSRSTKLFYTENPFISKRLERLIKGSKVYTITNYYNQIYDNSSLWKRIDLPKFNGITLLTISANYAHKNFAISLDIIKELKLRYPQLNVRFVFTINKSDFPYIPKELESNFLFLGKIDISQCPSLYEQSDIMFQPSLLECFTATYPEAMKMCKPIITSDLDFARGLCGDAAVYYSPLSAKDAADKIAYIVLNKDVQDRIINAGKLQLSKYDNYEDRINKLISILEKFDK